MALTDLTQKILDDAGKRADEIRANAKAQVATVHAEAESERSATRKAFEAETETQRAALEFRAHERTEHEARLTLEAARRSVLDEAFKTALENACNADDNTYRTYIEPSLQTLAHDEVALTAIYVPERRRELTEAVVGTLGLSVPVIAREGVQGGFVAEGPNASYDMRFEHLIEAVQRAHEPVIAGTIFTTNQ